MLFAAALTAFGAVTARADVASDCFSEDNERRIAGCTALLESPGLSNDDKALALAMRALGHSLKTDYDKALPDYDAAISLRPDFPIALNNRAWALFRSGRARDGLADVEQALRLSPNSPHAHDTRAHIRQSMGELKGALSDYDLAMLFGGERLIKLYQCGLQAHGLYKGEIDGMRSAPLRRALEACVNLRSCDPLPADEECRKVTS